MNKKVTIEERGGGFVVIYTDRNNRKQEVLKANIVQARKYAEKILRG